MVGYGALRKGRCVNREGQPIPWFTCRAIDFLSQLDLSEKIVFEYGAGASTLYWAKRGSKLRIRAGPTRDDTVAINIEGCAFH